MPYEPASDDDACSPAPRPAVDVDDASGGDLAVDLVERGDQALARRDREVTDRPVDVTSRWHDERRIRVELSALRQVDKKGHAGPYEISHLGRHAVEA